MALRKAAGDRRWQADHQGGSAPRNRGALPAALRRRIEPAPLERPRRTPRDRVMGSKGSNTTNTSQQQTYAPAGAGYVQNALQTAQNVSGACRRIGLLLAGVGG